jgi:hypothetical protein
MNAKYFRIDVCTSNAIRELDDGACNTISLPDIFQSEYVAVELTI